MKNRTIIAMCICLAVSITACSQSDNTQEPATLQSQSISENQTTASQQEHPKRENSQPSTVATNIPNVNDLDNLTQTYLYPILFSGATMQSWTDPNEIEAHSFIYMYGYSQVWNANIPESEMIFVNEVPYYYADENILEKYVLDYFSVSNEHLHTAEQYNAEKKSYAFNMSGVGFAYDPHVLRAEYGDENKELILFLDDGYGGSEKEGEVSILTIRMNNDGGFQYISNRYESGSADESGNAHYDKLVSEKTVLVELVRERVESYRNATPPEPAHHHPPYPSDFPPVFELPDIQSTNDFAVRFTGNPDALGSIYLAVPIDGDCELHMTISEYMDDNNKLLWVSGDTFFRKVSEIQWQIQDIDLYK